MYVSILVWSCIMSLIVIQYNLIELLYVCMLRIEICSMHTGTFPMSIGHVNFNQARCIPYINGRCHPNALNPILCAHWYLHGTVWTPFDSRMVAGILRHRFMFDAQGYGQCIHQLHMGMRIDYWSRHNVCTCGYLYGTMRTPNAWLTHSDHDFPTPIHIRHARLLARPSTR